MIPAKFLHKRVLIFRADMDAPLHPRSGMKGTTDRAEGDTIIVRLDDHTETPVTDPRHLMFFMP